MSEYPNGYMMYVELWLFRGHCYLVLSDEKIPFTIRWDNNIPHNPQGLIDGLSILRNTLDLAHTLVCGGGSTLSHSYFKWNSKATVIDWSGSQGPICKQKTLKKWLHNNGKSRKPDFTWSLGEIPNNTRGHRLAYVDRKIRKKWNNTIYNKINRNCLDFCLDYIDMLNRHLPYASGLVGWYYRVILNSDSRLSCKMAQTIRKFIKNPPCTSVVHVDKTNARVVYSNKHATPINEASTSIG